MFRSLASWPGLVQLLTGGQEEEQDDENVKISGILVKCSGLRYGRCAPCAVGHDMTHCPYGWLGKPWPYLTVVQRLGLCIGISESKRFPCLRGLLLTKHVHFNFFMHGELHVLQKWGLEVQPA
jgi:hypothetical protein